MNKIALIITLIFITHTATAEIYSHIDENGHQLFSDKPQKNSSAIELQPINLQQSPSASQKTIKRSLTQQKNIAYKSIKIISPANNTTIRNTTTLAIKVRIDPILLGSNLLVFLDNGQPIAKPGKNLTLELTNLQRGSHIIQVKILNSSGTELIISNPITIYIHLPSLLFK